jgi:hypothetical protein
MSSVYCIPCVIMVTFDDEFRTHMVNVLFSTMQCNDNLVYIVDMYYCK